MPSITKTWRGILVTVAVSFFMTACATHSPPPPPEPGMGGENNPVGWWNIRFQIDWPLDEDPLWHVDVALAHRVLSPVLERYGRDIPLWRVHRRAVRDQTGHQFSFVFFTALDKAKEISNEVAMSPDLQRLKGAGIVPEVIYDTMAMRFKPGVEGASDESWSLPLQKSWPYYIMGVSQTWLHLIKEFTDKAPEETSPMDVRKLLAWYKGINNAVNKVWHKEGGHALLHHLNAVFEYKDVAVYQKRLLTF